MDEKQMGMEQELYLAPEKEIIENAEKIAEISLEVEKYPFIIGYDANEKDNIITELQKLGCDKIKQLDFANCIAVSMSMAQLKAIKTLDGVEKVEKDYDYKCLAKGMSETDYATYLAGKNSSLSNGNIVKLAIFDTGVTNVSVNGSVNFVNDVSTDENGHGIQMAGIISSVIESTEKKVASPSIYPVVVADHRGFAKTSAIMQALDWAINNGIKIICMSFGDYHKSELLENMINRASNCGIIMVAAVGNDGGFEDENQIMYPAAFDNVLSVGATNGESVANYSNGGTNADCYACGSQTTTNVNGNPVNVIGTSGATAFVAGTILKNWCVNPEKTSLDIIADIKTEMSLSAGMDAGMDTAEALTLTKENDMLINEKENIALDVAKQNARTLDENASAFCIGDDCDDGCSSNDMASSSFIPFLNWKSGRISCPGNEVWYRFTANVSGVHPNGSPGWYTIHTQGSLDTIGYLYDSYGNQIAYNDDGENQLNFNIWAQLDYHETYYIKVKAYGNNTGDFDIRVSYFSDDHGNTMDTATEVIGVYYQDKSVTGHLHSQDDVDYYTFVPARNCVMEIYTEGDTDTYGQLYCGSGGLLDSDNNSNGNGNFKITAHLEAMKRYYIAVSHNSSTGFGDYTLRFRFVKDYCNQVVDEQYRVMYWYADNQDEYPEMGKSITRSMVYVSNRAKAEFEDRVILDEYNQKTGLKAVLDNGTFQDVFSYLLDSLISSIPLVGSSLSYAFNVGSIIYDFMSSLDLAFYREKKHAIENTNQYIIGEHYWFTDYPTGMATGSYNTYSTGSGTYYGKEYQRGEFIEAYIKN